MNAMAHRLWILTLCFWLAVVSSLARAAHAEGTTGDDPQPLVADTINQLIDRLHKNSDRIQKDQSIAYRISDELVVPHIDFPRIARLVIGRYWRDASDKQRNQLVEEIRSLLIRSYVSAMTSYADQIVAKKDRISYLPSRYEPGDRKASVRASIALEGGQTVQIQYQLYKSDDQWRIYDIVIEGISLAITYRTSFGEQIRQSGIDSLIAQLAERNSKGDVELPTAVSESLKQRTATP
jgi:phospholipid transport system substrate-binding protein